MRIYTHFTTSNLKGHNNAIFDSSIDIKCKLTWLFDIKFAENSMPFPVTVKMDFKVAKNFFHLLSLKRNKIFSLCNCPFSQRKVKKMGLLKTSLIEPKKRKKRDDAAAAAKRKTHLKLQFCSNSSSWPFVHFFCFSK